MKIEEAGAKAKEFLEKKELCDKLKKEVDVLKDEFKDFMKEQGVDVLDTATHLIKLGEPVIKNIYDLVRMTEEVDPMQILAYATINEAGVASIGLTEEQKEKFTAEKKEQERRMTVVAKKAKDKKKVLSL
jgi:hypothetical protein